MYVFLYVLIRACLCGTVVVLLSCILGVYVGYNLRKMKGSSEFFCVCFEMLAFYEFSFSVFIEKFWWMEHLV